MLWIVCALFGPIIAFFFRMTCDQCNRGQRPLPSSFQCQVDWLVHDTRCELLYWGGGQRPLCLWPSIFSHYTFWIHHPVNQDDRHLLAHAMASDFTVTWQFISKRTIDSLLQIELHALIQLGVSPSATIFSSFHLVMVFIQGARQRGFTRMKQ
jgi:hypothetical protein